MASSLWKQIRQGRYRWTLRLAVMFAAGAGALAWLYISRPPEGLSIENRSGQTIAKLRVTLGGQTMNFRSVASGATVSAPWGEGAAKQFVLEGELADGTLLRGRGTIGEVPRLIVLPGGQVLPPPPRR